MKKALFLFIALIFATGCERKIPTKTTASIEGKWREYFQQVYFSPIVFETSHPNPPDTVAYISTLTFENGRYRILLEPPMEPGQFHSWRGSPLQAEWEGLYTIRGDTIHFLHSDNTALIQQYIFKLWGDSLKLTYAPKASSPGDSMMIVPPGGLPWGYAWMKLGGMFHRVEAK